MWRSIASREAAHRQVKAAPKQMDGAAFTDKARAKKQKDPLHLQHGAPIRSCCVRVVGARRMILGEGDCVGNFTGHWMDLHRYPKLSKRRHCRLVECGNTLHFQFHTLRLAL